jgi:hypothetical protein
MQAVRENYFNEWLASQLDVAFFFVQWERGEDVKLVPREEKVKKTRVI